MASQIKLNLGAALSALIKNANDNFDELYKAVAKIEGDLADGGQKAVVYSNVDNMITGLQNGKDENDETLDITVGSEIYILDEDTPDFWVSKIFIEAPEGESQSTKPKESEEWSKNTEYTFGKYVILVSKSREIDLTQYQTVDNIVTKDLWNSVTDQSDWDSKYPSARAVFNALKNVAPNISGGEGNVKDVTVNNKSVLNDKGIAAITLSELESGYLRIPVDSPYWTVQKVGDTWYHAIMTDKIDTAIGVFNKNYQEVVIQKIYDNDFLYLCVNPQTESINECYVRLMGGTVIRGGLNEDELDEYLVKNKYLSKDNVRTMTSVSTYEGTITLGDLVPTSNHTAVFEPPFVGSTCALKKVSIKAVNSLSIDGTDYELDELNGAITNNATGEAISGSITTSVADADSWRFHVNPVGILAAKITYSLELECTFDVYDSNYMIELSEMVNKVDDRVDKVDDRVDKLAPIFKKGYKKDDTRLECNVTEMVEGSSPTSNCGIFIANVCLVKKGTLADEHRLLTGIICIPYGTHNTGSTHNITGTIAYGKLYLSRSHTSDIAYDLGSGDDDWDGFIAHSISVYRLHGLEVYQA
jgi:hypothetical protein